MDVIANTYDGMTLSALLCYFLIHDIHISIDMIHVNTVLLSSSDALHTSGSTNPIITRENSTERL